jgi:predicted nuclease of predicted toxin-antitoxin system
MSVRLYLDEHVNGAVKDGLRRDGIDVLTAQEDGRTGYPDPELLLRATELGRVLVTFDQDYLALAARSQRSGERFCGVIFEHLEDVVVGKLIDDLKCVAYCLEQSEMENQIFYLPLP